MSSLVWHIWCNDEPQRAAHVQHIPHKPALLHPLGDKSGRQATDNVPPFGSKDVPRVF